MRNSSISVGGRLGILRRLGLLSRTWAGLGCGAMAVALLVGCERPGNTSPSFHLNDQNTDRDQFIILGNEDPEQLKRKQDLMIPGREYISSALEAMFGTPDHPFVFRESGLDLEKIWRASGPAGGLRPDVVAEDKTKLIEQRAKKQKELDETLEPDAKKFAALAVKPEADIKALDTRLAAARTANNAGEVATLEKEIAALKPAIDAKAAAEAQVATAKGSIDDLTLVINSSTVQQGLYRQHCVHCHGVTGDGAGPTALFLFPYPRDYRQGIFKFKATERSAKPTHEDLTRILVDGIADTAMPSFRLLQPDEIDSLVEYVKYLAVRGEAEQALKDKIFGDEKLLPPNRAVLVKTALKDVVDTWKEAESKVIAPGGTYSPTSDQQAWLDAGKVLFTGQKGQCYTCHGLSGIGDGRKISEPLYDFWNKDKKFKATDEQIAALLTTAGKNDETVKADKAKALSLTNIRNSWLLPEQQQYPRNLRLNRIRFGRAPLDIYRRIFAGINGTEMPGAGPPSPGQPAKLTDQEIWQLVDYVLMMPFFDENGKLPVVGGGHGHAAAGHGHAAHGPKVDDAKQADDKKQAGEAKLAGGE